MSAIETPDVNDPIEIEVTKGDVDGHAQVWLKQAHGTSEELILLGSAKRPMVALQRAMNALDAARASLREMLEERRRLSSIS